LKQFNLPALSTVFASETRLTRARARARMDGSGSTDARGGVTVATMWLWHLPIVKQAARLQHDLDLPGRGSDGGRVLVLLRVDSYMRARRRHRRTLAASISCWRWPRLRRRA
jgi:hypothetical protein